MDTTTITVRHNADRHRFELVEAVDRSGRRMLDGFANLMRRCESSAGSMSGASSA